MVIKDMKQFVIILCLVFPFYSFAEYDIRAIYSKNGEPSSPELEDSLTPTFPLFGRDKTKDGCLFELRDASGTTPQMALGNALREGMTDVVLMCEKLISRDKCSLYYPGCEINQLVGKPKHYHVYTDGSNVPSYLKLKKEKHQVVQMIIYGFDDSNNLKATFVRNIIYDKNSFMGIVDNPEKSCKATIKNKSFSSNIRKYFFKSPQTKAIRYNCFSVNKNGKVKILGSELIKKK